MMGKTAVGHQTLYTNRINLPSVLAVHMVYLVICYVVVPWFLTTNCDHHFENDKLKIVWVFNQSVIRSSKQQHSSSGRQ